MRRFLAVVLLSGCLHAFPLFAGDDKPPVSDDRIIDQIRMKLTTDADVKGGADEVTVQNGAVTIKGNVDTEKGKNKASKLAKKIKGVKSVDNQLVVKTQ